ncbi:MAG: invasion associated locus B family protein [Rhodomicrobium sp.]
MLRSTKLIAASVVLALASAQAFAQSEVGSGQVKAIYGTWKLKCGQLPGAKNEKCVLVQDLALEDQKSMFLTVIVLRAFDGDKKYLRVVAPLAMLIPAGLGLKVDGAEVGHVPFVKCYHQGCVAEVTMDDQLLAKFSTGTTASFIVFPTPEKGIGFPAPLAGFSEGLKGLN